MQPCHLGFGRTPPRCADFVYLASERDAPVSRSRVEALAGGPHLLFRDQGQDGHRLSKSPSPSRVRKYFGLKLLVIDEVGDRELERNSANTFVAVVLATYETAATVYASNGGFAKARTLGRMCAR